MKEGPLPHYTFPFTFAAAGNHKCM